MPKKIKTASTPAAAANGVASPVAPAAPPARKRAASSKSSAKKPAATKKAPAGKTARKPGPAPSAKAKSSTQPSDADIATRAYFIAERRMQLSIPGDSAHDWLEAKRQLMEEASDSPRGTP